MNHLGSGRLFCWIPVQIETPLLSIRSGSYSRLFGVIGRMSASAEFQQFKKKGPAKSAKSALSENQISQEVG